MFAWWSKNGLKMLSKSFRTFWDGASNVCTSTYHHLPPSVAQIQCKCIVLAARFRPIEILYFIFPHPRRSSAFTLTPILITMANINKAKWYRAHLECFHRNLWERVHVCQVHTHTHINICAPKTTQTIKPIQILHDRANRWNKSTLLTFPICFEKRKKKSHSGKAFSCRLMSVFQHTLHRYSAQENYPRLFGLHRFPCRRHLYVR